MEEEALKQTPPTDADIKIPTPPTDTEIMTPLANEELSVQTLLATIQLVDEEDNMPYPYPKYNDEPDMEAHVQAFLITWPANHVSQELAQAAADASKIIEFGLSLEGQVVSWYSLHGPKDFTTFMELRDKFLHVEKWIIDPQEEYTEDIQPKTHTKQCTQFFTWKP